MLTIANWPDDIWLGAMVNVLGVKVSVHPLVETISGRKLPLGVYAVMMLLLCAAS